MSVDLHCRICKKTCSCLIYGEPVEHAHYPGGLDNYPLCDIHEKECLDTHRSFDNGKWIWINNCGNLNCGYCKALASKLGTKHE